MVGLSITPLSALSADERGSTHEFMLQYAGLAVLGLRKSGTLSGRHFHKGLSRTKNPETLLLLSGKIRLLARNLHTGEQSEIEVSEPSRIEISPFVWHELSALTDITFLELNSISEHAADTFYDKDIALIQGANLA